MPIEFNCSQCNQLLRVAEANAGKSARCPKCQALMTVPAAGGGPASAPSAPPPPAFAADPPGASPPPNAKPAGSPFSDEQGGSSPFGGPPSGSVNPYASPAAFDALRPAAGGFGRTGLPWETEPRGVGCWFRTMGIVLGSPSRAFSLMQQSGGMGTPIQYSIYGLAMPAGLALAFVAVIGAIIAVVAGADDGLAAAGGVLLAIVLIAFGAVLYVLFVATVGTMFSAAIYHLLLLMVGGARQGYETTFRVVAYSQGSLAWLLIIPYIGPTIMSIWTIVLMIIGLAQAHEISTGKSALAVFLPLIVCAGLFGVILVLMIALAAVGGN